ncbi:unnamed protein product, partial [Prunus brigantina]
FFLHLGCPTCINARLLFTFLHIANLTSLLSSLREIFENLYCLSKRGVAVHPKAGCRRDWWLLSKYREEVGGLAPAQDVERWKQNGPDSDDLPAGQEKCSAGLPFKKEF